MEKDSIKILIADDEADIRKIVRLLLEKRGYCVCEASNGLAAIEAVKGGDIDLVIMDIMMPKMSGIEATAKIREISMLPILFLTAKSLVRDKDTVTKTPPDRRRTPTSPCWWPSTSPSPLRIPTAMANPSRSSATCWAAASSSSASVT